MAEDHRITQAIVPFSFGYQNRVGAWLNRFIDGLGEQKIWGIKCAGCGRVAVPPRQVCGPCHREMSDWVEVGPEGTVESLTIGRIRIQEGNPSNL